MINSINILLYYLVNDIINNTYYQCNGEKSITSIHDKINHINRIEYLIKDDYNRSRIIAKKILKFMVYHNILIHIKNINSNDKYTQIFNYLKELNSVKYYDFDNYPLLYQTLTNIVYDFDTIYWQAYYIYQFILNNQDFDNINELEIQEIINNLDNFIDYIDSNLSDAERFNISEKLVSKTYQKYVLPMNLIDKEHIGIIDNNLIESMVIFGKPLKDYFDNFTDININVFGDTFDYY